MRRISNRALTHSHSQSLTVTHCGLPSLHFTSLSYGVTHSLSFLRSFVRCFLPSLSSSLSSSFVRRSVAVRSFLPSFVRSVAVRSFLRSFVASFVRSFVAVFLRLCTVAATVGFGLFVCLFVSCGRTVGRVLSEWVGDACCGVSERHGAARRAEHEAHPAAPRKSEEMRGNDLVGRRSGGLWPLWRSTLCVWCAPTKKKAWRYTSGASGEGQLGQRRMVRRRVGVRWAGACGM